MFFYGCSRWCSIPGSMSFFHALLCFYLSARCGPSTLFVVLESDGLTCSQWWTGCASVHCIGCHLDLIGWIEWFVARGVFICAGGLACIFVGCVHYI